MLKVIIAIVLKNVKIKTFEYKNEKYIKRVINRDL